MRTSVQEEVKEEATVADKNSLTKVSNPVELVTAPHNNPVVQEEAVAT